jgi:hypothetical protein
MRQEIAVSNNCRKWLDFLWQGSAPSDTSGQAEILGEIDFTLKAALQLLRSQCEQPPRQIIESAEGQFVVARYIPRLPPMK